MELTVRACANPEEAAAAIRACEVAFGWGVSEQDMAMWQTIFEHDRIFGVYSEDLLVGAGANYSFELTIPGGSLPTAGVTLIGVKPSHRRKGALRKIIAALHADAEQRGEPLAILWASESNIYQRFGYGTASMAMALDAERDRMAFLEDEGAVGQLRQVEEGEALEVLPGIYDQVCARTPGMYKRSAAWWKAHVLYDPAEHRNGGGPAFTFVLEIDGRATGYVIYRIKSEWDLTPKNSFNLIETMGIDPVAEKELWRFMTGVDLVARVKAPFQPVDYPVHLWVTEPRRLGARIVEALFLRILDLERALTVRGYGAAGALVIEVTDDLHPSNTGRWRLDTHGAKVSVDRTDDIPDVQLDTRDLAATYLGAFSLSDLLAAGRGVSRSDEVTELFDDMFRTPRKPWCPEIF
ncbi:MAG: GNAT family N-acetyltransferase [Actinomycetota bacterium]